MSDRLYDVLPLPIAQVLRDVARWRADVLAGRNECAVSELRNLAQSADELDRWEGEQERTDRVELDRCEPTRSKPRLTLILADDDDKEPEKG